MHEGIFIYKRINIWERVRDKNHTGIYKYVYIFECARGVMFIVVGNVQDELSSKFGRGCLHFTQHDYPWEMYESNSSPSSNREIVGQTGPFNRDMATGLGEGELWIQTC